jgi:hypothetical protein
MATTYTLINSVTVGSGGTATIDFTSIPQTYTDLKLMTSLRSNNSGGNVSYIYFNNTNSSLSNTRYYASVNTVAVYSSTDVFSYIPPSTGTANTFSTQEWYIPNYTDGARHKTVNILGAANSTSTGYELGFIAGLWEQNNAINRITLYPSAGSFVQYSTAYLYGIKNS